jgi:hypothetical protein
MTKTRAPLTFELALTKVAGHIGWEKAAEIVGQAERTVRNWSEPDTTASITLDAALKLDEEFHKAGGHGSPFFQCYATRLELAKLAASPGREALLASIAVRARKRRGFAAALSAAEPTPSAPTSPSASASSRRRSPRFRTPWPRPRPGVRLSRRGSRSRGRRGSPSL